MSTSIAPSPTPAPVLISTRAGTGKVTMAHVVNAEWIKFRTLRSTYFTLLAAVVADIGIAIASCYGAVDRIQHPRHEGPQHFLQDFSPAEWSLQGYNLAQLALGVLGVLIVTGEYSTGMIRASLSAVPRRLPMLWGKAAVFGVVAAVLSCVCVLTSFLVGQSILSTVHVQTTLSAPGVSRVVFGTALYLTVIGLLSVALGTMIRNAAGGIATLLGVLFIVPLLVEGLPTTWHDHIAPYLPSAAGSAVMTLKQDPTLLSPGTGLIVLACYLVAAYVGAAVVLKRRDA
ncbi:ABC-2 type transport system permease protein [Kitasatospora sp. MAA4]|uniref:ABC transporter permease n=1 Tax=Kitasatospora sp. MAA4 TaxID=3035093 RepID=UPI002474C5EB|nr:ABC transporter permease [Kitasatospora sp. MAA4]MDH6131877.1 ABC-2 type transport system permease protein [Kitasatospora sp. MAA4]